MDTLVSLLAIVLTVAILFALVNIIYPSRHWSIPTRKRTLPVLVASFAVLMVFSAIVDDPVAVDDASASELVEVAPQAVDDDATQTGSTTLAKWRANIGQAIETTDTLVLREDGMIVLETTYAKHPGLIERTLAERPSDNPDERKFELQPDADRSEYITVSSSGAIRYFSWEGREFQTAKATTIHPDFPTLGASPVAEECVPKELSATSKEVVRLYEQLQDFKDDDEFARIGFALAGPYNSWLEEVKRLRGESSLAAFGELGFIAGDVLMLGMAYVPVATRGEKPSNYIHDMERTIRAGLALASCDVVEDDPKP